MNMKCNSFKFAFVLLCLLTAIFVVENAEADLAEEIIWKFAVLCDTRGDDQNSTNKSCINDTLVKALADAIIKDGCDLVLVPGDLVNGWWRNCSTNCNTPYFTQFENWKTVMNPVYKAGIEVYTVRGNHEDGPSPYPPKEPYLTYPDPTLKTAYIKAMDTNKTCNGPPGEQGLTYSFSHNNAFFVGLDEYVNPHRVNQIWLDRQLANNNKTHVFVFGHEPAFQVNHSDCLAYYKAERDAFWNSIGNAGCQVYFCGHDHLYNRAHVMDSSGNKIYQMVIGSCGAPLLLSWIPHYNDSSVIGDYHNESACGYVLVTINGNDASVEWKALENNSWVTRDNFNLSSHAGASLKSRDFTFSEANEGPLSVVLQRFVDKLLQLWNT